ncbi:MAG: response regulator [Bryobacteraceae bacterium]|nr:response regulator [Bryobacteraceae bacterium]
MSKTILVVDDSPAHLELMQRTIEGRGWEVLTAADGEQALEKAETRRPDLILLDVVLPKKNGYQVCRQLKQGNATKSIKIIMVSSKSQESDKYWGLKQGADGYLVKPFAPAELLRAVEQAL